MATGWHLAVAVMVVIGISGQAADSTPLPDTPCNELFDAFSCYRNPKCGFCIETSTHAVCVPGNSSGPLYNNVTCGGGYSYLALTLADVDFINAMDVAFVGTMASCFFVIRAGYTVFETGACGLDKSSIRTLLRMKVIDSILASLVYYVIGYGLTYNPPLSSESSSWLSPFIGNDAFLVEQLGSANNRSVYTGDVEFFFRNNFAVHTATVLTGAVVGRVKLSGYLIAIVAIAGFIHPVAARWIWAPQGWLSSYRTQCRDLFLNSNGYIDFAGATVVGTVGGVAALVATFFLGASRKKSEISEYQTVLGLFLIFFGYLGAFGGSVGGIASMRYLTLAHVLEITLVSACTGGLVMFAWELVKVRARRRGIGDAGPVPESDERWMRHFRDLSFLGRRVDRAARLVANARVLLSLDLETMYDTRARRVGDARGADGMRIGGSGIGTGGIRMPSMAGSAGSLAMASSAESFANFGSPGSLGIGIGESNEADRGGEGRDVDGVGADADDDGSYEALLEVTERLEVLCRGVDDVINSRDITVLNDAISELELAYDSACERLGLRNECASVPNDNKAKRTKRKACSGLHPEPLDVWARNADLGFWASKQRVWYELGVQPESRIQALESIGFEWAFASPSAERDHWRLYLQKVEEFKHRMHAAAAVYNQASALLEFAPESRLSGSHALDLREAILGRLEDLKAQMEMNDMDSVAATIATLEGPTGLLDTFYRELDATSSMPLAIPSSSHKITSEMVEAMCGLRSGRLRQWVEWYDRDLGLWVFHMRSLKEKGLLDEERQIELERTLHLQWNPRVEDMDLLEVLNGILVSLVAVSGAGNVLPAQFGLVIGVLAVLFYKAGRKFEQWIEVEDPLNAFPIHAMGGILGSLVAPFASYGDNGNQRFFWFYNHGFCGSFFLQLWVQFFGTCMVILWTVATTFPLFYLLWFFGFLATDKSQFLKWIRSRRVYRCCCKRKEKKELRFASDVVTESDVASSGVGDTLSASRLRLKSPVEMVGVVTDARYHRTSINTDAYLVGIGSDDSDVGDSASAMAASPDSDNDRTPLLYNRMGRTV